MLFTQRLLIRLENIAILELNFCVAIIATAIVVVVKLCVMIMHGFFQVLDKKQIIVESAIQQCKDEAAIQVTHLFHLVNSESPTLNLQQYLKVLCLIYKYIYADIYIQM